MADAIELDGVAFAVRETILTAYMARLPLSAAVKQLWDEANPGQPPLPPTLARWGAYQLLLEWAGQIAEVTAYWTPDERKTFLEMLADFLNEKTGP